MRSLDGSMVPHARARPRRVPFSVEPCRTALQHPAVLCLVFAAASFSPQAQAQRCPSAVSLWHTLPYSLTSWHTLHCSLTSWHTLPCSLANFCNNDCAYSVPPFCDDHGRRGKGDSKQKEIRHLAMHQWEPVVQQQASPSTAASPHSPNSHSLSSSGVSPIIREALQDVDWGSTPKLPEGVKHDPRESPWVALSSILPGLYLTSQRTAEERDRLLIYGCRLVVKMNADNDESPYQIYEYNEDACCSVSCAVDEATFLNRLLEELSTIDEDRALLAEPLFTRAIPALDSAWYDISAHFEEVSSLIELVLSKRKILAEQYRQPIQEGRDIRLPSVVVHCQAGMSRSAAVVQAYLMKRYHLTKERSLQYMQNARPVASPNNGFAAQLTLWETTRGHCVKDNETARVAAQLIKSSSALQVIQLVKDQTRVLLCSVRLNEGREAFGRLIAHLLGPKLSPEIVLSTVMEVVQEGIEDQTYIESPSFLQNIGYLFGSLKRYAPTVLSTIDDTDAKRGEKSGVETNGLWLMEDYMHESLLRNFCREGMDASEGAEAAVKYVAAVATLQIASGVDASFPYAIEQATAIRPVVFRVNRHINTAEEEDVAASQSSLSSLSVNGKHEEGTPPSRRQYGSGGDKCSLSGSRTSCMSDKDLTALPGAATTTDAFRIAASVPMALSIAVLPTLAAHGEGFIPWAALEGAVEHASESLSSARKATINLRELLKHWFLVSRADGALGALGTQSLTRWSPSSSSSERTQPAYLHFLQGDIEVIVLEALEKLEGTVPTASASCEQNHVEMVKATLKPILEAAIAATRQALSVCPQEEREGICDDEDTTARARVECVVQCLSLKFIAGFRAYVGLIQTALRVVSELCREAVDANRSCEGIANVVHSNLELFDVKRPEDRWLLGMIQHADFIIESLKDLLPQPTNGSL